VTFQTTLEFPLTVEFANTQLTDLGELHRFVMAATERTPFPSQSPRSDLGLTFHLGLPGDDGVGGNLVNLLVRSAAPLNDASTTVTAPANGTPVRVRVTLVAEKRVSRGTGHRGPQHARPLTDPEAIEFALRHLSDAGLHVDQTNMRLSDQRKVGRKGAINFTIREVVTQATVNDQPSLTLALERGIGRGLNYGFGLLKIET